MKKAQYQEIAEALIQFFIAQTVIYTYIIQKLVEEQKAPTHTSVTCMSACSSTLKLIEI